VARSWTGSALRPETGVIEVLSHLAARIVFEDGDAVGAEFATPDAVPFRAPPRVTVAGGSCHHCPGAAHFFFFYFFFFFFFIFFFTSPRPHLRVCLVWQDAPAESSCRVC